MPPGAFFLVRNYEKDHSRSNCFFAFSALSGAFGSHFLAVASDNAETQVQDAGTDLKTGTNKNVRKVKRGMRKATGQDSIVKDAGDHVNDSVDDVKGSLEKANH
jgi:hypothetical protein